MDMQRLSYGLHSVVRNPTAGLILHWSGGISAIFPTLALDRTERHLDLYTGLRADWKRRTDRGLRLHEMVSRWRKARKGPDSQFPPNARARPWDHHAKHESRGGHRHFQRR